MQEPLCLPAELTIYSVGEWAPRLRAHLANAPDGDGCNGLWIDAAALQEVDASGVQLLLALANTLAREQRVLQLAAPSEPLVCACNALGASALLAGAAP